MRAKRGNLPEKERTSDMERWRDSGDKGRFSAGESADREKVPDFGEGDVPSSNQSSPACPATLFSLQCSAITVGGGELLVDLLKPAQPSSDSLNRHWTRD